LTAFCHRCIFAIMIKTQVQLPDALYREVKRVAQEREMSLAEVIRRGAEYITQIYLPLAQPRAEWKLPGPFDLGVRGDPFANEDWRYDANLSSSAQALIREKSSERYGRRTKKKP